MLKLNLSTIKNNLRKVVLIVDSIITYLLIYNQHLIRIIYKLLIFISKYVTFNQMIFYDSNNSKHQRFKANKLL